jgi:formate hydrogenlyase transcriptional activator
MRDVKVDEAKGIWCDAGVAPAELPEPGQAQEARYEALFRLSRMMNLHRAPKDLFRALAEELRQVVNFDAIALFLYDEAENKIQNAVLETLSGRGIAVPPDFPAEETLTYWVYKHQEPVLIPSRLQETRFPGVMKLFAASGIESCAIFPLTTAYRKLGSLAFASNTDRTYREEEIRYLQLVTEQVAMAVDNALRDAELHGVRDQLFQENIALRQEVNETALFEDIVGRSEALQKVLKDMSTVAPTDSTVLIYGETGTGKELIARGIHNLSARSGNAFVKVNCAAIPTGLLESEFFGHEKGAFTGAVQQRIGRFELANHGTVFLDEIGEIPLELQPKLLRVLQEREYERLGSSRTLKTDARLIAATNQDLSEMVKEQKFRSDLFYRLNVFPIHVPPLRERPEDLPMLVRHFAEVFSRRMGKSIETIPAGTMEAILKYSWPGNVRELQNVIERAVILSNGGVLRVPVSDLTLPGDAPALPQQEAVVPPRRVRSNNPPPEREQVLDALKRSAGRVGGNLGAAARLGMKRTTLIALMKRMGIDSRSVIDSQ